MRSVDEGQFQSSANMETTVERKSCPVNSRSQFTLASEEGEGLVSEHINIHTLRTDMNGASES